jgi:hypothetical protein
MTKPIQKFAIAKLVNRVKRGNLWEKIVLSARKR